MEQAGSLHKQINRPAAYNSNIYGFVMVDMRGSKPIYDLSLSPEHEI